jgi:hypothetical protein
VNPSLIAELCRGLHAKRVGVLCALRHGQISVDGYVMREEYDRRWAKAQLQGRYARFYDRTFQLYGAKIVGR